MSLTNMQYDEIIRSYNRIQFENKRKQTERIKTVTEAIPRIAEITGEISSLSVQATRLMLNGSDSSAAIEEFRSKKNELVSEKKKLLLEHGFPADYMELKYNCPHCRDTGYISSDNGDAPNVKCQCFKQAEIEILYNDSNIKDILKRENFDSFRIDAYDDIHVNEITGKTAKANMQDILKICHEFTENFKSEDRRYKNLVFLGETGVGKTFITNCIAKELLENAISVVYLSSIDLFDTLGDAQFSRDNVEAKNKVSQIFDCDLLIIDDLGTELTNSYTGSALFNVVNERIISKKSCIISTNLDLQDLTERYSERLTSRLTKEYKFMKIYGNDLRHKRFFT